MDFALLPLAGAEGHGKPDNESSREEALIEAAGTLSNESVRCAPFPEESKMCCHLFCEDDLLGRRGAFWSVSIIGDVSVLCHPHVHTDIPLQVSSHICKMPN